MLKKFGLVVAGLILSVSALARGHHSVTVYYAPYCGACHAEMNTLRHMGVPFRSIDVQAAHINIPFVPLTVIDGKSYTGELSQGQLEQLLS